MEYLPISLINCETVETPKNISNNCDDDDDDDGGGGGGGK